MTEIYIFAFGLVVTLIVGSGLVTMIVVKNRDADGDSAIDDTERTPAPAPARIPAPLSRRDRPGRGPLLRPDA